MPCNEANRAIAPILAGRKVRTPKGSEPDNIRVPIYRERQVQQKINQLRIIGVMGETVR